MKVKMLGRKSVSHLVLRLTEILILSIIFSPVINLIPGEKVAELGSISFDVSDRSTILSMYFANLVSCINTIILLFCVRKIFKNLTKAENIKDVSDKKNYRYVLITGISIMLFSFIKPVFDYLSAEEIYNTLLSAGVRTSLNYTADYELFFIGIIIVLMSLFTRIVEKETAK